MPTYEELRRSREVPEDPLREIPPNRILGMLSRLFGGLDERMLRPLAEKLPMGEYIIPRTEAMAEATRRLSAGESPLEGSGMTTGIKPWMGWAGLEATDLPQIAGAGRVAGKLGRRIARPTRETDVIESLFGPKAEWDRAKRQWDAQYACGGQIDSRNKFGFPPCLKAGGSQFNEPNRSALDANRVYRFSKG